jgi:hypothetical protein
VVPRQFVLVAGPLDGSAAMLSRYSASAICRPSTSMGASRAEGEARAELEKGVAEPAHQGLFEVALGDLPWQPEEVEHIRVPGDLRGQFGVLAGDVGPFQRPLILHLVRYVKMGWRYATSSRVAYSKAGVLRRDRGRCAYCGLAGATTMDHVLPRSRGGRTDWLNAVAAHQRCNAAKGARTPAEAGMTLLWTPWVPSPADVAFRWAAPSPPDSLWGRPAGAVKSLASWVWEGYWLAAPACKAGLLGALMVRAHLHPLWL